MRQTRVRYGESAEIKPRPLVGYNPSGSINDVGSELSTSETVRMWDVSLPYEVLRSSIGSPSAIQTAIQPNSMWYVNQGNGWIRCRVLGTNDTGDGLRIGIKLAELGYGDYPA